MSSPEESNQAGQCCGSGSGAFLTPGSGMGKIRIRIWIRDPSINYESLSTKFELKSLKYWCKLEKGKLTFEKGVNCG
jgi:hypothetical protein